MLAGGINLHGHPRFDPYHLFVSAIPFMVDSARSSAKNDSFSYRGFRVGAALFALNHVNQDTGIFTTGNVKKTKHSAKVCAEKKVLSQAQKGGYLEAIGLVVVATSDVKLIEEVTGIATPTLHPCDECRDLFDKHPLMKDDTLIVTTGLEADTYQVHTHGEMKVLYNEQDEEALMVSSGQTMDNWEFHIATYGFLESAEHVLPVEERRPLSKLAHMALLAAL